MLMMHLTFFLFLSVYLTRSVHSCCFPLYFLVSSCDLGIPWAKKNAQMSRLLPVSDLGPAGADADPIFLVLREQLQVVSRPLVALVTAN